MRLNKSDQVKGLDRWSGTNQIVMVAEGRMSIVVDVYHKLVGWVRWSGDMTGANVMS